MGCYAVNCTFGAGGGGGRPKWKWEIKERRIESAKQTYCTWLFKLTGFIAAPGTHYSLRGHRTEVYLANTRDLFQGQEKLKCGTVLQRNHNLAMRKCTI